MKNVILILLSIISFQLSAQDTEAKTKSNTEQFYAKTGKLIQKEYVKIGKIKRHLEIDILNITDLSDKTKISGLKFEMQAYTKFGSSTKSAFVDTDEIADLVSTLDYLQNNTYTTKPIDYTELSFTSRSGFQLGAYYAKNKWNGYMKLERYDGDSTFWFDVEDTKEIYDMIKLAQSKL